MRLFFIKIMIVVACISSCSDPNLNNENSRTINIDTDKIVKFTNAEILLDTLGHSIIILDTADNNFIGNVSNLQISGDKMYIWDRDSKIIFIYGTDGSYLSKIASQGRARNEYIDIHDYYVSEDNLYILDNVTMKILIYDTIGKYIKTLDVSMYWANSLFVIDNMIYLINYASDTKNGRYHIFKIDNNGELVDTYLKFSNQFGIGPDINVYSEINNTFKLCILPINRIYKIDSSECQSVYNINFTNRNLPEKYYERNLRTLMSEKITDKYILGVDRIYESSNHIFISFLYKGEYCTAIYNKISEDVEVCNGVLVTSFYGIDLGNYFIRNGYIYNVINATVFKIIAEGIIKNNTNPDDKYIKEIDKINQKIIDYSNPVIIKYKLR